PITVGANASKQKHRGRREPETVGDFVRKIFSDRDYYGTMLPRLPTQIERDIQVNILLAEKIQNRAKKHLANRDTMSHFQKIGSKVMALYGDDENPTTWYEAAVDRVITRNEETAQPYKVPKFVVTFPEYGNTETVTLGEMEMLGVPLDPVGAPNPTDDRGGDSRDGERSRYDDRRGYNHRGHEDGRHSRHDLYDEVRQRERERATGAARRPPSGKAGLSPPRRNHYSADASRGYSNNDRPHVGSSRDSARTAPPSTAGEPAAAPKKRSAEEIAAIQEKKRKLMSKYG
ncbi:MAG: hypothetical protein SGILL_007217, partial [Bacillariaceae sp.]